LEAGLPYLWENSMKLFVAAVIWIIILALAILGRN